MGLRRLNFESAGEGKTSLASSLTESKLGEGSLDIGLEDHFSWLSLPS